MTFLLDTCVLSELIRPRPNAGVAAWLGEVDEELLHVSVLTIGELEKGVSRTRDDLRRAKLAKWIRADLAERFRGRVLPIDQRVAVCWGALVGKSETRGIPLPVIDSLLGATCLVYDLVIVTRNTLDFERCGARCLDPWSSVA